MADSTIVFLVLALVVVLFVADVLPVEIVAVGTAVVLWAGGVLDIQQALAGFGDPTVVYVVQPGDTLWSIARRADPGADPRPLVDRLVEVNDLRGALHAGDQLRLPADLAATLAAG